MVQKVELEQEDYLKHGTKTFDFNITVTLINVLGFNFSYSCNLIAVLLIGFSICIGNSRTH